MFFTIICHALLVSTRQYAVVPFILYASAEKIQKADFAIPGLSPHGKIPLLPSSKAGGHNAASKDGLVKSFASLAVKPVLQRQLELVTIESPILAMTPIRPSSAPSILTPKIFVFWFTR